ncbi:MAG: DoxX family protein [Gemmatimonadota bacterium]
MTGRGWARLFCRMIVGLLFLMAGWFKVFEMTPMGHATRLFTEPYADTWIPHFVLLLLGLAIPIVELLAGFLLVVGWRTREALVALGVILVIVTYGHTLKEPIFSIAEHILPRAALIVAALVLPAEEDALSVDGWLARRGVRGAGP